jgi:hypothetical protein
VALLALLVVPAAHAAPKSRGLRVRPEVQTLFVWDDNVYLDESDEDDFAVGVAPRVRIDAERERWRAGADLGADLRWYVENSELSEDFWRVSAWGEVEPIDGLTLRVADHYVPQPVTLGRPEDETANLRQSNTLLAEARYWRDLKRETSLEVGARATRFTTEPFTGTVDADGDGVPEEVRGLESDYFGSQAWTELRYDLGRGRVAFGRVDLVQRSYDEIDSADYVEAGAVVGLRTPIGRRIRLEVAAGWGFLDFAELPDDDRLLGRAELRWDAGRGWSVGLSLLQRLTGDATGTDFGETSARLDVEKLLGRRTSIRAAAWWSWFDEGGAQSRDDRVFAVEVMVRRRLTRRFETFLAWRRWENRGDFDADDFTQNRVTLGLAYRY